ncbi:hypothetical protein LCGC14_0454190 [marine sediment metagenome]|uniref:Uncharacterized protein n=1 Tax=marine sediment metagenome TaxID=412755 RepID=A0A0F9SM59_9ZZZZ
MRVYFDEVGYPSEIEMKSELKDLLESQGSFERLKMFHDKITSIIVYWNKLESFYKLYQNGKLPEEKFKEKIEEFQQLYFNELEYRTLKRI